MMVFSAAATFRLPVFDSTSATSASVIAQVDGGRP